MSWLKLNDSLNKVKGSITSFTQEVFADGIIDEDSSDQNPVRELNVARGKIDELTELCVTQDQEIATLRKQVAEYQQQLHQSHPTPSSASSSTAQQPSSSSSKHSGDQALLPAASSSGHPAKPSTSQSGQEQNATSAGAVTSTLEDSWFWDSENNISSTSSSSKKDDNESPSSGTELTTIPLEAPASEGEIIERLQRQLGEKIQQLKKQQLENALLNEKLGQVSSENRELNENIEELDRQHEVVLENLVAGKRDLQEKCNRLEADLAARAAESQTALQELRTRFERLEQSYTQTCAENVKLQQETEKLTAELERIVCENMEAVAALEGQLDEKRREQAEANELYESLKAENEELRQKSTPEEPFVVALPKEEDGEDEKDRTMALLRTEIDELKESLDEACTERDNLQKLTAELDRSEQIGQLEREIGELQNELRSVIIDNSVQLEAKEKEYDEKLALLRQENQSLRDKIGDEANNTGRTDPNVSRLVELVRKFYDLDPSQHDALEQRLQQARDLEAKLSAVEKRLLDSSKELNFLKMENSRIQHDKDTLNADLMQYEKECSNLMKNNDLLIAEIENLKCNKLETINENAEDSIVVLEKQLEDSTRLNRSLEEEYRESQRKLEELMEENEEQQMKVTALEEGQKERKARVQELEQKLRTVGSEKEALAAQLEQLRQSGMQETEQLRSELESVQGQLGTINEDHASLVHKLQQLQQTSSDNVRQWESKLEEMRLMLEAKESDLAQAREATGAAPSAEQLEQLRSRLESELAAVNEQHRAEMEKQKEALDSLTQQKENLVQLVTTKHNESVQYHAEIQRLSQLLQAESERSAQPCPECPSLREKVQDYERLADQIQFLREKSDILTANLMTEQNNQRMALQEKQELLEQRNGLQRDQERLRQHLMEIEEAHTQETVELQQRYDEARHKLATLEDEVKKSTNALTSASIRANQHAETLQTQYQLLLQQRDELNAKLGAADDRDQKNQASLTNLQCALEQFQMNRERDIELATVNIRKELEAIRARDDELKEKLRQTQQQLSDAKNGLLAAARISDQLEISQVTVASLKAELAKRDEKYAALEHRLQETEASQADKVEKTLVKNLIIGYAVAPNASDKQQIMKLISSVLTMDQAECTKVGLHRGPGGGGWLNSILGSGATGPGGAANYNKESLTEAFVKFLEKESAPRATANSSLLNIVTSSAAGEPSHSGAVSTTMANFTSNLVTSTAAGTTGNVSNSAPVQPILLPEAVMLQQTSTFAPTRSSSSILKDILSDS
ncbi:putative leucine-rich repeat-containing protein DDB_G0290503 [Anopheles coustani]|uniref:putative leucine-rich repeat-containing protein DDB_G0290503 n=1 Tax=Anopheles coustani TaxID=139045 RepID=UPI00265B4085|nr:putative leucine-rich repeat-containing protein DDB_G0290503 [Anopheles coustani]